MNACLEDNLFGPVVHHCRDNFDFTLLFEQSILSIAPSAIFLLLVPYKLISLVQSNIKSASNVVAKLSILVSLSLVGLQLALLVLWTNQPATRASVAAAALSLIDSLAILALVSVSSRSIRPSSILTLYLLLSGAFNAVELRTLYLRAENSTILGVSTTILTVKVILISLELQDKRRWLFGPYQGYSPESTSNVISRGIFWWLNPLMKAGFRKLLSLDDLYTTDAALQTGPLERQMRRAWKKFEMSKSSPLLKASIYCFRWPLLSFVIPRTILIGFNYAQPFLISRVVEYVGQPASETNKNDGYGLIGAAALIYIGVAIAGVQYQHKLFRTVTMFRGSIVSLIYTKALAIPMGAYEESAALTLMSTDVDRIAFSFESLAQIWAYTIEIIIGIYLLQRQVGWICFAPIVVVLIGLYGATLISKYVVGAQKAWVEAIQKRVAITSPVLNSMKAIKMMGLSSVLFTRLQNYRVSELDLSAKFRQLSTWRIVLSDFPQIAGPFVVFVIFAIQASVRGLDSFDTSQAFTSLAIITLMTGPAGNLVQAIPSIGICQACFVRIEKYLQSTAWEDQRGLPSTQAGDSRDVGQVSPGVLNSAEREVVVLELENVSIRPSANSELAVQDLSLKVMRGSFVMITGPVGSGKTTLIRGILGEIAVDTGAIEAYSKEMAYCSQTPWLPNGTIREIICGTGPNIEIDYQWYDTVIQACALEPDIVQLVDGHDTVVGTRGVALSGGQKQRLALARAVYARKDIVLLDDVLSALDNTTERLIIDGLLGSAGLFRKMRTTVIMAGHSSRPMSLADNIVVLNDDGSLRLQSKWTQLRALDIIKENLLHSTTSDKKDAENEITKAIPKALKGPSANDIEDLQRQTGDVSLYLYYAKSIGPTMTAIICTSTAFCAVASFFPQIWIKWYATKTISGVGLFCGVYALLLITAQGSVYLSAWVFYCLGIPKSGAKLHEILLTATFNAPQSFFDKTDAGVTLNRFSQDMTLVDGPLPAAALITLQAALNVLVLIALVAAGSSYMGLTIPLILAVLYLLQKLYLRTSRQIRFLDLEAKSPLYSQFVETLEGLSTIRAFSWQSRFADEFQARLDISQKPYYLMYCIQRWLNLALGLIIGAMAILVIALAIAIRSSTNSGSLGVALNGILSLDINLQYLMMFWTSLETSLSAVARTRNFERDTSSEIRPEQIIIPSSDWPSTGKVEFANVQAKYESSEAVALAISNIIMDPSSKTGVIGRSGSGKSTLLSIMTGLLPLSAGEILIDDIPISSIPVSILRERIVTIPQDPFIIPGLTVRENADLIGKNSDEEIISCLSEVGLWSKLLARGGLDGEMPSLSQGEGQVFALARAVLRKTSDTGVLLLDEATSNTDHETDEKMSSILKHYFQGWTVVMIAHRLESVRKGCETVILLDQGRIAKTGSMDEMIRERVDVSATGS